MVVFAGISRKKTLVLPGLFLAISGCALSPEPLTYEERKEFSESIRTEIIRPEQEPISKPIDLYEAMARAIKYNLDQRVELQEASLGGEEARTAHWALLPQLVANSGYNGRNNFSGASSSALLGPREIGSQSLVSSTSSERNTYSADLNATWNILDFGVSYIRAHQANDEYLIALEQRRRVVNQIIQEVRTVYWRAASAERVLARTKALQIQTEEALAESKELLNRKKTPPLAALTYQRELLSVKREVQQLQREISVAKAQLSALMNVHPGDEYSLVLPKRTIPEVKNTLDLEALTLLAFNNRPEMRDLIYRGRINDRERKAILLELLPSIELYGGANYDNNDFLFNSNWLAWGARVSWNLIQAIRVPQRQREIAARDSLIEFQAYSLGMAIMTQLHVSVWRYGFFTAEFETANDYASVQSQIIGNIRSSAKAQTISKQTLIREEMNDLLAQIRFDIAHADLQNAFATIYTTIGLDPYSSDVTGDESVDVLAASLRKLWKSRGDQGTTENSDSNISTLDSNLFPALPILPTLAQAADVERTN